MTGKDEDGNPKPSFGDYPPDFFDLIVIDECHRGGANDESNWRGILEYFKPAVQLGLTATPKRDNNADTYAYFGEPVYTYSLKEGIDDGYLTPFKVEQSSTTLDVYTYTTDDEVLEGDPESGKRYGEDDFNRIIEIEEREKKRVEIFMDLIDQSEKTLIFCATQDHAAAVRNIVSQKASNKHPDYCVRVTARDGSIGDQHLKTFKDNEKTIPTILTTSKKLSTGVDALNIRHIVLMRPIKSMIEFKQIIGRGTRLFEGKDYFTVHDFVNAYEHFSDPEWDGEPAEPVPTSPRLPLPTPTDDPKDPDRNPPDRPEKIRIKLADGKERTIQHMRKTSYWGPDGKPLSAQEFLEYIYGELPALFESEDELRAIWIDPETRRKLLKDLEEKGFGREQLDGLAKIINAQNCDLFDVLGYVAFAAPTVTREERVDAQRTRIFPLYEDKQHAFLRFVLERYVDSGIQELDDNVLPKLIELKYGTVHEAREKLGEMQAIRELFIGFQKYLYESVA